MSRAGSICASPAPRSSSISETHRFGPPLPTSPRRSGVSPRMSSNPKRFVSTAAPSVPPGPAASPCSCSPSLPAPPPSTPSGSERRRSQVKPRPPRSPARCWISRVSCRPKQRHPEAISFAPIGATSPSRCTSRRQRLRVLRSSRPSAGRGPMRGSQRASPQHSCCTRRIRGSLRPGWPTSRSTSGTGSSTRNLSPSVRVFPLTSKSRSS